MELEAAHLPQPSLKTVGPQAARLLQTLHEQNTDFFTLQEVSQALGMSAPSARTFIHKIIQRGLISRVKPGLYALVPPEISVATGYLPEPHLTARALVGDNPYFLSHGTAMELHGMATQPQFSVITTTPKRIRNCHVHGMEFKFLRCQPENLFGITHKWITSSDKVLISSMERTIVDGLAKPSLCGGFTEVAKGVWTKRNSLDYSLLGTYAERLDKGSVVRRLGFLLHIFELGDELQARLASQLTHSYAPLDPDLPEDGVYDQQWRLNLNVSPKELHQIIGT